MADDHMDISFCNYLQKDYNGRKKEENERNLCKRVCETLKNDNSIINIFINNKYFVDELLKNDYFINKLNDILNSKNNVKKDVENNEKKIYYV